VPTGRRKGSLDARRTLSMEDVVAVEVELEDGARRYFLTWGRIQDAVDPGPLCALVLAVAPRFALGGTPAHARLCETLRQAAGSDAAPYFYECLLRFAR
jgi:hypothetical protein